MIPLLTRDEKLLAIPMLQNHLVAIPWRRVPV